jgi:colanic acid biosynthesis glycosyl transferase WcaI
MRRFDRVIAVSSEMAAQVGDGRGVERVSILRNWADLGANGRGAAEMVREFYGIDEDCVVVLYSGSIGRKQGLDTLIRAAGLTAGREICFVVCGEGPGMDEIKQTAWSSGNVRFLPLQDEKRHRLLLCRADIHLILQRGGACGAFMPSKLANICSCGGALICSADRDCELSRMVAAAGGMIVGAESPGELSRGIVELAGDGQRRRAMGERARSFAGTYFDKQSALTILESLIAS